MCLDPILKYFNSIQHLPASEWEYFTSVISHTDVAKGECLFMGSTICRNIFFVMEGGMRLFYVDAKGKEITYHFCFENTFVTAFSSFINQTPSLENIMAMENCQLVALSRSNYKRLLERHTVWPVIFSEIFAMHLIAKIEREMLLLEDDCLVRFRKLLSMAPSLFLKVEQRYIASYLRMSAETFSRMKRQIYMLR
jgi:CRP-like cAMP-binding protein